MLFPNIKDLLPYDETPYSMKKSNTSKPLKIHRVEGNPEILPGSKEFWVGSLRRKGAGSRGWMNGVCTELAALCKGEGRDLGCWF